jgi:hypothetical protein
LLRAKLVRDLAVRIAGELEVARKEGLTELEIGAAIGWMLGQMVPAEPDRDAIMDFAKRHVRAK